MKQWRDLVSLDTDIGLKSKEGTHMTYVSKSEEVT